MEKTLCQRMTPYLFLIPAFTLLAIFGFIPFLKGFYLALCSFNLLEEPKFAGVQNFFKLTSDPLFKQSLGNTFYYILGTIPSRLIIGLALAVLVNQSFRGISILRAMFYFPVIAPLIIVSVLWKWLFNTELGLINQVIVMIPGLKAIPWLTSTAWAMPAIMMMSVWKTVGWNMVIFLAGLKSIPDSFYEAAKIDGANAWTSFWRITLPFLRPAILLACVMSTINASQVFEQVYVMTGGGPGYATMTLVQQVYSAGFQNFEMGYAAAIGYVLFGIVLVLTLLQFKIFGKEVEY